MDKAFLRIHARQTRNAYVSAQTPQSLAQDEDNQVGHFLSHPLVKERLAKDDVKGDVFVGVYVSMGSEASTTSLHKTLRNQGYTRAIPILIRDHMAFVKITHNTVLTRSDYGFLQPTHWAPEDICYPDIVLTPLLAFDQNGHRLGYGKGHFDRYFANEQRHRSKDSLKVGWAYDCQLRADLLIFDTDQPLDLVVTPTKVWSF